MSPSSFQASIPDNLCFGCGPRNPQGLHLESYWAGPRESTATYQPQPFHAAGPKTVVNGGIIATVIDCHCICTAVAFAYRCEDREIGSKPHIWYATGSLKVSYLRPAAIDRPLEMRARIEEAAPKKTIISCTLSSGGETCAQAEVVAVRVPPSWRDSMP